MDGLWVLRQSEAKGYGWLPSPRRINLVAATGEHIDTFSCQRINLLQQKIKMENFDWEVKWQR